MVLRIQISREGEWLKTRPNVPLPEAGTSHSIKIDYNKTTLNITLDGKRFIWTGYLI